MKTISIITNKKVDKTFEGEDCLLKRTIISTIKEDNKKRFIVRTERANYYDVQYPLLNEDGTPQLDEQGNELIEAKSELKVINKKDSEAVVYRTQQEIDFVFNLIKDQVNFDNGYFEFEQKVEQLGLLLGTQQDKPFGTQPEDWQLLND